MMVDVLCLYSLFIGFPLAWCSMHNCQSVSFERMGYVEFGIDPQYEPLFDRVGNISFQDCIQHLERRDYRWLLYNNKAWTCSVSKCKALPVNITETPTDYSLYVSQAFAPSSCLDIKLHEGTTEDGEYWLTPAAVQILGCPTKVYCHNMTSPSPSEFITLPNPNEGQYPNKSNHYCQGEGPLEGQGVGQEGHYIFNKIRVEIKTLTVVGKDYTFVTVFWGITHMYGISKDCYAGNDVACGRRGTFHIDTLGTGLMVDPQMTWRGYAYKPYTPSVQKSQEGAKIDLLCGGVCGGCVPDGDLTLHLNTGDVIIP